uniref:MATH domain-containing protein n=1 Tax=Globodera rostochiensis TaxID=31243 RepID=A0A914HZA8_GLORO
MEKRSTGAAVMNITNLSFQSLDDDTECSWHTATGNHRRSSEDGATVYHSVGDDGNDNVMEEEDAVNSVLIVSDSDLDDEEVNTSSDGTPKATSNGSGTLSDCDDAEASSDGTLNVAAIGGEGVLRGILPSFSSEERTSNSASTTTPSDNKGSVQNEDGHRQKRMVQLLVEARKMKSQKDNEKLPKVSPGFQPVSHRGRHLQQAAKIVAHRPTNSAPLFGCIKHSLPNFRNLALNDQLHSFSPAVRVGGAEWKVYVKFGASKKIGLFLVLSKSLPCMGRKLAANNSTGYSVKITARILHPISHCAPYTKSIMRRSSKTLCFQCPTIAGNVHSNESPSSHCWGLADMAAIDTLTSCRGGFVDYAGKLTVQMDFTVLRAGFPHSQHAQEE